MKILDKLRSKRGATGTGRKVPEKYREAYTKGQGSSIVFVSTTRTVDRDGEVVLPEGVKEHLATFEKNPVMLWGHDHNQPIGRVLDYTVGEDENTFSPEFAKHEFAQAIKGMVEDRVINATSIGFIPIKAGDPILEGQEGATIEEWELIEQSLVAVPSNRGALRKAVKAHRSIAKWVKHFGMPDLEEIATRSGIQLVSGFKSKEEPASEPLTFASMDEVVEAALEHLENEEALEFTKNQEGDLSGTTAKAGEGDTAHDHELVVRIEDGEIVAGVTSAAEDGHRHNLDEFGKTSEAGDPPHSHGWLLQPEGDEVDDDSDEGDDGDEGKGRQGAGTKNTEGGLGVDDDEDFDAEEDMDELLAEELADQLG